MKPLLAVLLVLCACHRHPAAASHISVVSATSTNAGDRQISIKSGSLHVEIEISSGVELTTTSSVVNGVSSSAIHIGSALLDVVGGELHIGGTSYGKLPDHAKVRVHADGVFIDGQRRGILPP